MNPRWALVFAVGNLAACATHSPPSVAVRTLPVEPAAISCDGGRQIVYAHPIADGSSAHETVTLRCSEAGVTLEAVVDAGLPDSDEPPEMVGPLAVSRATFDAVWRAAIDRAHDHGCVTPSPSREGPRITFENDADKRSITCAALDGRWAVLLAPLEAAVRDAAKEAKPQPDEPFTWPFAGEYWKDELGYAR